MIKFLKNEWAKTKSQSNLNQSLKFLISAIGLYLFLTLAFPDQWFINLYSHFYFHCFVVSAFLTILCLYLKKIKLFLILIVFSLVSCFYIFRFYPSYENQSSHVFRNKLYFHNINSSNNLAEDIAKSALALNPDIISLIETSPEQDKLFNQKFTGYENKVNMPRFDNFGFSIYSKFPIKVLKIGEYDSTTIYIVYEVLELNTTFILVHLLPPMNEKYFKIQEDSLNELSKIWSKSSGRTIMTGDFNMTPWSSHYIKFFAKIIPKYYSSSLYFQGSWPSFMPRFFQIPIDHAFSNEKFGLEILDAQGSDHLGFLMYF